MALSEGQQLGPYRVISQLGTGGMATIYKAQHERLGRTVAIKMLHPMFLQDDNFLARFEREAQIVAQLEHPHIVPVYDFSEFERQPYLVMKYIEGRTLRQMMDRQPPTLEQIVSIMEPIAQALDYAHQRGVLHRDIKPSNIILDTHGMPFLTDFGLARMAQLGESTLSTDMLLGTPHYISPEQAQGIRDLDARTDIYSLGVVLYELLSGRVPFSADTPFAVIHDHIYRELPPPSTINPEIPAEVDAVLSRALAKTPAARYSTAAEMIGDFKRALRESGLRSLNPDRKRIADDSQYRPLAPSVDAGGGTAALPTQEDLKTVYVQTPEPKPIASAKPPAVPFDPFDALAPRPAAPPAPEKPKRSDGSNRKIEATIDFNDLGNSLREIGASVKQALEEENVHINIGGKDEGGTSDSDLDLAPPYDERAAYLRVQKAMKKRNEFFGHLVTFIIVNLGLIAIGGGLGSLIGGEFGAFVNSITWQIFPLFGWGAGLAAHAIETYFQTGSRATRRTKIVHVALRREYGDEWWTAANKKELKKVRSRALKPVKAREEFLQHLAVYTLINAMLWLAFGRDGSMWPIFVTGGWGIGLVINAFEALGTGRNERAIEKAVERERRALLEDEDYPRKRKNESLAAPRDPSIRMGSDGEFTDSMIQEIEREQRRSRR